MRRRSSSLVGSLNYNTLQRLRVDLGVFGASTVTVRDGLMEADLNEAQLKQQMVGAAGQVIGIVDASKWGVVAFSAFALPHEIDRLITDERAPVTMVEAFRSHGIIVDLV